MILYPAIDVFGKNAVRLTRGDYAQMTVYSSDVAGIAHSFADQGATHLHMVDLEGAKSGETPNFEIIAAAIRESGLMTQVGGGIRTRDAVKGYLDAGAHRVILGTAAARDPKFLEDMLARYGAKIAVGVDIRDGLVATHGWTEITCETCEEAFARLGKLGVKTVIVTDISRDGMLAGANTELYGKLARETDIDIIASGGVSAISDITSLRALAIHGAILGKALYEKKITLPDALEAAGGKI